MNDHGPCTHSLARPVPQSMFTVKTTMLTPCSLLAFFPLYDRLLSTSQLYVSAGCLEADVRLTVRRTSYHAYKQLTGRTSFSTTPPVCARIRHGADLVRLSSPSLKSFPTPTATLSLSRYEKDQQLRIGEYDEGYTNNTQYHGTRRRWLRRESLPND